MLAPQSGQEQGDRLRRDAMAKLERAERLVERIEGKKLTREQQDSYRTVQSFVAQAREALAAEDYLKASTLTEKASVLAEELSQQLK